MEEVIVCGREQSQVKGRQPQVEGGDCLWRGAIASGGYKFQLEGSDRRWRGPRKNHR